MPPIGQSSTLGTSSPADRDNNFGLLRLAFATFVVLSHSTDLIDGNRSRELLTRVFGTMSFGEVGLDGFFLISGYLVTKSYLRQPAIPHYLWSRILRIYPAFLVATLLSIVGVGLLTGFGRDVLAPLPAWRIAWNAVLLRAPGPTSAFVYNENLNTPMWSVSYEFRCYLVVIALGVCGLFRLRWLVAGAAASLLVANIGSLSHLTTAAPNQLIVLHTVRLTSIFLTGACFFLFRDLIPFTRRIWPAMLVLLGVGAFLGSFAELFVAICGGYLVFYLALSVPTNVASRWANRTDISYGVYLYAWPVQNLIFLHDRTISPWILFLAAMPLAASLGWLSWHLVEQPMLSLKRQGPDLAVDVMRKLSTPCARTTGAK